MPSFHFFHIEVHYRKFKRACYTFHARFNECILIQESRPILGHALWWPLIGKEPYQRGLSFITCSNERTVRASFFDRHRVKPATDLQEQAIECIRMQLFIDQSWNYSRYHMKPN